MNLGNIAWVGRWRPNSDEVLIPLYHPPAEDHLVHIIGPLYPRIQQGRGPVRGPSEEPSADHPGIRAGMRTREHPIEGQVGPVAAVIAQAHHVVPSQAGELQQKGVVASSARRRDSKEQALLAAARNSMWGVIMARRRGLQFSRLLRTGVAFYRT